MLESTAKKLEVKPTVATVYSQTRFSSSAYVQWERLANSYSLFIEAMKQESVSMRDEEDPLQYQILGQVGCGCLLKLEIQVQDIFPNFHILQF